MVTIWQNWNEMSYNHYAHGDLNQAKRFWMEFEPENDDIKYDYESEDLNGA